MKKHHEDARILAEAMNWLLARGITLEEDFFTAFMSHVKCTEVKGKTIIGNDKKRL